MKYTLAIIAALLSSLALAKTPTLKGSMTLSVKQGTIDADFQLSDIPPIENYLILINSGMNIEYLRNEQESVNYDYKKAYNATYSNESFGYYLPDETGDAKFLPETLSFKYTGKYPVIADMSKASDHGDWKGNIAFNGKTVRADGLQAAWYPVLYDVDNDVYYDKISYDISINCSDCQSIYVNGSQPIADQSGQFSSNMPTSLMLFAGDYDITEARGSLFLNTNLSAEQVTEFASMSAAFVEFYENQLNIPYGEKPVLIRTTPVAKKKNWLFVSYPAVVYITHAQSGFADFIDAEKSNFFQPFYAHELAHYYFANYRMFNSALGDMIMESFSEYLAMKITKALVSEERYAAMVEEKLNALRDVDLPAISHITSPADYGNRNRYVYTYSPIIWLMVEQEIGEDNMYAWMTELLTADTDSTDYEFLISTLGRVLDNDEQLNTIKTQYLSDVQIPESLDELSRQ
ncbi:hypothetical protein [Idiomarina xiamenensis]|uniref:Peptidase M1 membrane alanine aminopeptidase domain-containing protein n=1 Tax=Idiomarina xiamenensis 10-D-4 TaxID=740709 RepID=K2JWA5_9GAMM|nr:hypothetical protein [Idiomarina xiamenensis]EKE87646.1 hypothetical protein A10D4_01090 [Idiomarina xiamenensis 10-D-4]